MKRRDGRKVRMFKIPVLGREVSDGSQRRPSPGSETLRLRDAESRPRRVVCLSRDSTTRRSRDGGSAGAIQVSAQVVDRASRRKGVPIGGRTLRLLLAATAALALCCASAAHGADLRVRASQDTQVDATAPKRSGGAATTLRLTAKPLRRAFMRFDLRKVRARPTAAVLRLYVSSRSGGRVKVNPVAPGQRWSEKRTTFKTRPAIAAGAAPSKTAPARASRAIHVTKLIRPGRLSDLAVGGAPRAVVASSESAHRPRLIVKPRGGPPFPPPGPPFPPPSVPPPFGGAAPAVDVSGVDRTSEGTTQTFNYTVSDPDSIPT